MDTAFARTARMGIIAPNRKLCEDGASQLPITTSRSLGGGYMAPRGA